MKSNKTTVQDRNWFLVFIASIILVIGIALTVLALTNIASFGWWSLLIGFSGVTAVGAAVMSIVKNDPSWILLQLIIPG